MVDARLPDGSRVNAVIPPLAVHGPSLTIRKFSRELLHGRGPGRLGTLDRSTLDFLARLRRGRAPTSSSPAAPAPARRRCSTCCRRTSRPTSASSPSRTRRAAAQARGRVSLETRPPNIEGKGQVDAARPGQERAAHAARPHHRRRVPRRRGVRHAPGDEHRPRRLADHRPRQLAARRARPHREHGADGGVDLPIARHPRADRVGHQPAGTPVAPAGRLAAGHPPHRDRRHAGRGHLDARHLRVPGARRGRQGRIVGQLQPTGLRPHVLDRLGQFGEHVPLEWFLPLATSGAETGRPSRGPGCSDCGARFLADRAGRDAGQHRQSRRARAHRASPGQVHGAELGGRAPDQDLGAAPPALQSLALAGRVAGALRLGQRHLTPASCRLACRSRAGEFLFLQLVLATAGGLVGALLGWENFGGPLAALGAAVIGFVAPLVWLRMRVAQRQHCVRTGLARGARSRRRARCEPATVSNTASTWSLARSSRRAPRNSARSCRSSISAVTSKKRWRGWCCASTARTRDCWPRPWPSNGELAATWSKCSAQMAMMLRERERLRRDVRVITTAPRVSGYVVALLPLLTVMAMYCHQPLLHRHAVLRADRPSGGRCRRRAGAGRAVFEPPHRPGGPLVAFDPSFPAGPIAVAARACWRPSWRRRRWSWCSPRHTRRQPCVWSLRALTGRARFSRALTPQDRSCPRTADRSRSCARLSSSRRALRRRRPVRTASRRFDDGWLADEPDHVPRLRRCSMFGMPILGCCYVASSGGSTWLDGLVLALALIWGRRLPTCGSSAVLRVASAPSIAACRTRWT